MAFVYAIKKRLVLNSVTILTIIYKNYYFWFFSLSFAASCKVNLKDSQLQIVFEELQYLIFGKNILLIVSQNSLE